MHDYRRVLSTWLPRAVVCLTALAVGPEFTRCWADETAAAETKQTGLLFENDVFPILKAYCWRCHGGEGREADLDLRSFALIAKGSKNGPIVVSGAAEKSRLYQKMAAGEMPPGKRLKPTEQHLAVVRQWIDSGAAARDRGEPLSEEDEPPLSKDDRDWWAFRKPVPPLVPRVKDSGRVRNAIDAFLLKQLEEKGLGYSPEAKKATLSRRLHFDLIGLPPEPEQVDDFVSDTFPGAYERLIDRLLASPHYGERWGRHWLDAAGYVDTIGSDNDASIIEERAGIWKYRDYVVRSFNEDKGYDRFLLEQIAGDELIDWRNAPTFTPEIKELLTATGFLRQAADVTYAPELNTADIRHQVLYDTLQIFSTNVLGLTVHCAQCHSHKFDPISHADYYRLAAVFTPGYNVQNWKHSKERFLPDVSPAKKQQIDEQNTEIDKQIAEWKQQIETVRQPFERKLFDDKVAKLPVSIRAETKKALGTPAEKRNTAQKELAEKYGPSLQVKSSEVDQALDEAARQRTAEFNLQINTLAETKQTYGTIQAFWENGSAAPMHFYRRGDYQTPGPEVGPGVIAVLDDPQQPFVFPQPTTGTASSGQRTALARWLARGDHPLTARVIVNRVWQHYFGRGIVATPDNFGLSGMLPSHPQLLDWLATEFVRNGWSFKHLHRLILTSSAYRQVSTDRPNQPNSHVNPHAVDPENLLLWKMPLRRLESEIVRDCVLATSGSLNRRPGGAPIPLKPLPDGSVEIDLEKLAAPEDQYRRSLYVFARRNYQLTEMSVFDQPKIAHNCTRRVSSAVVLQSLTMLNGKFLFDQARLFAARVGQQAGTDANARIQTAFRIALSRGVAAEELALSRELLREQATRYQSEGKLSPQAAADAALNDLCQMLMNSNEFLNVD